MPEVTKPRRREGGKRAGVLVIIVCFLVTVFCLDYVTGGYVLSAFKEDVKHARKREYYAVQTASFSDEALAVDHSLSERRREGAGYVLEADGEYRVLHSVFAVRSEAEKLARELGGEVFTIECEINENAENYLETAFLRLGVIASLAEDGASDEVLSHAVRSYVQENVEFANQIDGGETESALKAEIERFNVLLGSLEGSPEPSRAKHLLIECVCGVFSLFERFSI